MTQGDRKRSDARRPGRWFRRRVRSPLRTTFRTLRPSYDGPTSWLWFVGAARIGVLLVVALGTNVIAFEYNLSLPFLAGLASIYLLAFASSVWYLAVLRRQDTVSATLTWTQMLVDFGVVAATISLTRGQGSFFTFLLVIVILEAGVLMGLYQGFVFATIASAFMLFQFAVSTGDAVDPLTHWYNFLIQAIAFFFTAFISGYWNQRVSKMKQFQREILDNMNSGFLIADAKGLVIAVNKAACKILNLHEPNVAGRHVDGIIRPESGAECPVTTALRRQKDFSSYEFYAETDASVVKLLGLTTNRIRDSRGQVTGLIASFTDLTEMAKMRQELRQQDRMAAIGEQLSGLAHEIRNPLAAIRSSVAELARNKENPAVIERLCTIAVRESDTLNEIVTGFLDFARDPRKRQEQVDVRGLVADVREQLERKYAGADGLHITAHTPENPCEVLCDPMKIRQVFLNLGQNAVEAMEERGTLAIIVECGKGPVEVRFEDEGPGIAPDKVARIFEPFYTEKERGVGMGLAVCMRIITAHDGSIQVAARPGGGTTMQVRLPRVQGN